MVFGFGWDHFVIDKFLQSLFQSGNLWSEVGQGWLSCHFVKAFMFVFFAFPLLFVLVATILSQSLLSLRRCTRLVIVIRELKQAVTGKIADDEAKKIDFARDQNIIDVVESIPSRHPLLFF